MIESATHTMAAMSNVTDEDLAIRLAALRGDDDDDDGDASQQSPEEKLAWLATLFSKAFTGLEIKAGEKTIFQNVMEVVNQACHFGHTYEAAFRTKRSNHRVNDMAELIKTEYGLLFADEAPIGVSRGEVLDLTALVPCLIRPNNKLEVVASDFTTFRMLVPRMKVVEYGGGGGPLSLLLSTSFFVNSTVIDERAEARDLHMVSLSPLTETFLQSCLYTKSLKSYVFADAEGQDEHGAGQDDRVLRQREVLAGVPLKREGSQDGGGRELLHHSRAGAVQREVHPHHPQDPGDQEGQADLLLDYGRKM